MIDVYLEEHMRISRSPASYQFFTEQSRRLDEQLEAVQDAARRRENGLHRLDRRPAHRHRGPDQRRGNPDPPGRRLAGRGRGPAEHPGGIGPGCPSRC